MLIRQLQDELLALDLKCTSVACADLRASLEARRARLAARIEQAKAEAVTESRLRHQWLLAALKSKGANQ